MILQYSLKLCATAFNTLDALAGDLDLTLDFCLPLAAFEDFINFPHDRT